MKTRNLSKNWSDNFENFIRQLSSSLENTIEFLQNQELILKTKTKEECNQSLSLQKYSQSQIISFWALIQAIREFYPLDSNKENWETLRKTDYVTFVV